MKPQTLFQLLMPVVLVAGCSLTHEGFVFKDPKQSVRAFSGLRRIAIVPNRLPLLMVNTEQWRKQNWELIRKEFEKRGFKVVDYETSVHIFQESGLPLEDSTAVRDKYAQLCEDLLVDAIIIPYYATIADTSGAIFITHSYHSLATFQIYLKSTNHFVTRLDASGTSDYHTGFTVAAGIASTIATISLYAASASGTTISKEASLGVLFGGLGLTVLGAIIDIGSGAKSKEKHWTEAFEEAIPKGLEPVFSMLEAAFESAGQQKNIAAERKEISALLLGGSEMSRTNCDRQENACEIECKTKHQRQSCIALAQTYWIKNERAQSVDYYKRACDLGSYDACRTLGTIYLDGTSGQKNIERAIEYYDEACGDGGDGYACYSMGSINEKGQSVTRNLARALNYYQKGCKQHYVAACDAANRLASTRSN